MIAAGGVVVFPTETAYGLAADPTSTSAVRRIFQIKGRSADKQLPLVAASLTQAQGIVNLTGKRLKLAKKYWPGPLTIVAHLHPGRRLVGAAGSKPTVAIRVPALIWARVLAGLAGKPLTSTSANLSGRPAIYDPAGIRRSFAGRRHQPDLFLDAGRLPARRPSTIVAVDNGHVRILRPGPVTVTED